MKYLSNLVSNPRYVDAQLMNCMSELDLIQLGLKCTKKCKKYPYKITLPETNKTPETLALEDEFPC